MRRLSVAVIATLLVALVVPAAAGAQGARPALRLASQTAWVGRGDVFRVGLTADDGGRSGLEVTVSVHRPLTSRTEFERTLEGTIQGSAFKTATADLSELRPEPGSVFRVELQVQDPDQPRDPTRIALRGAGVYPVRVELGEAGGGRVLSSFVTHLVYVPDPVDGPQLSLAWVAPVHAKPGRQPDGDRRLPAATSSALATLATELEQRHELPVTLAPTPETLDSLGPGSRSADLETLARLARVARMPRHQVVGGTYVPAPLSLFADPLQAEGTASVATGNERLDALLETRPDGRTRVVSGGVTEAGLARLRDQQVDKVVLPESELAPVPGQRVTLAQPFEVGARQGRRVQAGAADGGLADHFRSGVAPVLAAHHLLADLAVIYFDFPGRTRGVVAVPPRTWVPGAAFLAAFLDGLATSPLVDAVTLDEYFAIPAASVARGRPLVRTLAADATGGPTLPVATIRSARARLDAFGALLDANEPIHSRLDRTLLVAPSLDLRPAERAAYANGVIGQVNGELGKIHGPAQRSITLTARRGRIPVTVQKDVSYPVRIVIRVEGDQLQFPGGATRSLRLTRRNTTELFTVQARSSGAFPLTVTLESPDGRLTLSTSRFTVRSTAASGLGVVLSVGAGAVLLAWWARSFSRRRRGHRVD
ncbi:MAG: hypothetical protein QOG87_865 [Actinomycetota bacterium]|jgi:hypothetical protein